KKLRDLTFENVENLLFHLAGLPEIAGSVHPLTQVARSLDDIGTAAGTAVDDFDKLATAINKTIVTADSLEAAMVKKVFDATMSLDQAILGVNESLTRLDETFKKNGKTLDIHTAKGQANREAVLASVTANMQQYQALVAAGA